MVGLLVERMLEYWIETFTKELYQKPLEYGKWDWWYVV